MPSYLLFPPMALEYCYGMLNLAASVLATQTQLLTKVK